MDAEASDRINCELCQVFDIHKNDFENHLKSRGHRKKLRKRERGLANESGQNEEERFECEYCNRTFRGKEFYEAHKGSKTHRRNLKQHHVTSGQVETIARSSTKSSRSSRKSRRLPTGELSEVGRVVFFRQKYKTHTMKIDDLNYKSYVYSLTAYLSLRLALDENVEDFKLSVNDREWQVFGDLVINVVYKDRRVLYAIQCKKITQTRRQIDQLEEAKVHITKQYQYLAQLRDSHKDVNETKFVMFTTCTPSSNFIQTVTLKPSVLNKWKSSSSVEDHLLDATLKVKSGLKKNDIINVTSDPENTYAFVLSDNIDCHLPQLFFYTGQRILPSMTDQLLKQKFDKYPDISTDYSKYIERWVDGQLGGNYKINKKDVVLKLGEILLDPYIVLPKNVYLKQDSFAVWNQVISSVDLTVVKNKPFTISKICRPLNLMIEQTLSLNIDTITKSVRLKKDTLKNLGEPFKSYFFEVAYRCMNDDIPLHLVYNVFWKAGRIPLLMSSENQEEVKGFILDVILFMKKRGVHKKFLIKSADLNLNRYKDNLKIFTCLDDVKDLINLDEVKIRVSDSFQLPLSTIISSDPFFCKWITPNVFFDISVGKYSLKPSHSPKKVYNKKDVLKIILSDDVKDELERHLYPRNDEVDSRNEVVDSRNEVVDSRNVRETRLRGICPGIL